MFDVDKFMAELATKRPIFHSEADFQHAFAWQFHEQYPNATIRLEYPIEGMHLDILLTTAHMKLAIELKYKTLLREINHNGEYFYLKSHSAQDGGRYDFLRDITRLERVKKQSEIEGYAILLTHDSQYWFKGRDNTVDKNFRLYDGRTLNGDLGWYGNPSKTTIKGREEILSIWGNYLCKWEEYPSVSSEKFRYLALKI